MSKLNLLILTQKVDINDDLLGFMHGWIIEFAKYCDKLTVICLRKGEYSLPNNVKVLSLGKETKILNSKSQISNKFQISNFKFQIFYLLYFFKYIWQERKNYDCVFVHMNKEYVLLGGLFWKLWKKKIMLWYNHRYGNLLAAASVKMANNVFYASPFSFMAKYAKARQMPAGIDTKKFKVQSSPPEANAPLAQKLKIQNSILFLGRISPVKNVDVLIKAVRLLSERGVDFVLNIAGEPGEKDEEYFIKIKEAARDLEAKGKIKFLGKVPNYKTPEIYNQNEIFINLTNSGSLDKTTLEAMSCERLVIVCNRSYENIFPFQWHDLLIFKENDEKDLADKIVKLINLNEAEKKEIGAKNREIVMRNHSLDKLVNNIFGYGQ